MSDGNQNGWNEYSRLVLTELEKLNHQVGTLSTDIEELKREMSKIDAVKSSINDVQTWKKDISEVVSPTQLKELKDSVEGLKTFKTVSTTVWIVVQSIFGLAITLYSIFK